MEPNQNDSYNADATVSEKKPLTHLVLGLGLVLVLLIGAWWWISQGGQSQRAYQNALELSTSGVDQEPLRSYFVEQVAAGVNDATTRSAIYWITHRYFDNGGDIYEIHDYIESDPNLAFIKEAETYFPDVFERIKTTRVENYSLDSLIALLAYYEAIDNNGYGNLAIWGLAANKYAEQALENQPQLADNAEIAANRAKWVELTTRKVQYFLSKADNYIVKNTTETGNWEELRQKGDITDEDLLVGLNQYAAAVLHMRGTKTPVLSVKDPIEVFEHTSQFSLNYVPRLYLFTNYLYASALVRGKFATTENVAVPMNRVLEYIRGNEVWRQSGSIYRILGAKDSREAGLFAHKTVKQVAFYSPAFKAWLLENDWTEADLTL